MKKTILFFLNIVFFQNAISQSVNIKIDIKADRKPISKYIYGRNNSVGSTDPNGVLKNEDLLRFKDAGITIFRENGGNNGTKYNFRNKLSSHPDWYNNVYNNDWDSKLKAVQQNFPEAQATFSFNLIGKAAKTGQYNFNDWGYNKSQWWEGVNQNLAGKGELNATGGKAKKEGDPNLYLENWPSDSTVKILEYWFGPKGKGFKPDKVQYWGMDNEPEIWLGTHDDVMPNQIPAEDFIQKYVDVAIKAKAINPNIKLLGPVAANEWQWYNYDKGINYNGKKYNWSEYFIMRLAEIQKTKGVKLLDVFDIHFYPGAKNIDDITQLHRVFFDKNYIWPEANGVKNITGNWDNSQNKEYIFSRVNDWLDQYFGKNHGIGLGVTEIGINGENASATAVWYANTLGTFIKNGVEVFTPWSWKTGMWETLHLFTKYNKNTSIAATSSNEEMVNTYPTINKTNDTLTVVLVNRSQAVTQNATINFDNFVVSNSSAKLFTIKSLPSNETFISSSQNALISNNISVFNNKLDISLAPLSVNSIQLVGKEGQFQQILAIEENKNDLKVSPNPVVENINLTWDKNYDSIEIINESGKIIYEQKIKLFQKSLTLKSPEGSGIYFLKLSGRGGLGIKKFVKN